MENNMNRSLYGGGRSARSSDGMAVRMESSKFGVVRARGRGMERGLQHGGVLATTEAEELRWGKGERGKGRGKNRTGWFT
jgi:hypothetical protein